MKVAVLMTCYNRAETTLRCLKSLFAQSLAQSPNPPISNQTIIEVWLVDDASPDGTGEKVKAAFPQVNVIRSPGNLFWCKGTRLAWDTAAKAKDYDGYLWLNDDVELYPDALATLLADAAQVGDEAILIGALHAERSASEDFSAAVCYGVGYARPTGRPERSKGAMNGNFVYVPQDVFRKIGPLYGGYGHGYADHDYGWMADRAGIARYCLSKAVGFCPYRRDLRTDQNLKSLSPWRRFLALFGKKGFSLRDNFIYKWRNFGWCNALMSSVHVIWIRVVCAREN